MKLTVNMKEKSYDIHIKRGAINNIAEYINLDRKVLIISDDGVPKRYVTNIIKQCKDSYPYIVASGETAKSFTVYGKICEFLLANNFTRSDLIIAVGGGVVGDLSGFVASSYMRGIDFCNIPTTTLSQIDSSIGGKVGINLNGVKNIIGAFYQPKVVIIDSNTLLTLTKRHFNNGLVEAVKAGLIYDKTLFEIFENREISSHIDDIIYRSLLVKKQVVEQDEKEQNLRKILNFGHTIGHAIESVYGLSKLYHGECVAIGMIPMIENPQLVERTLQIYEKLNLKSNVVFEKGKVLKIMLNDKKSNGKTTTIVKVKKLGQADLVDIDTESLGDFL